MAATEITTTAQNITGDFDLGVRGTPSSTESVLLKSLGSTTTNWVYLHSLLVGQPSVFVKNTGTNSYKLAAAISGVTIEFSQ